jgi:hypothetical protein
MKAKLLNLAFLSAVLLLLLSSSPALGAPGDYVEEDDEEVIPSYDGQAPGEKPKLPARPPFTLHDYNASMHAWITPIDEKASLLAAIETSYIRTIAETEHAIKHLPAYKLLDYLNYILNPDGQPTTAEEEESVTTALTAFKITEGLAGEHENKKLNLGYLNKGSPYRLVSTLMVKNRRARRVLNGGEAEEHRRRRLDNPNSPHLHGLWEHEIGCDVVLELPREHTQRVRLDGS